MCTHTEGHHCRVSAKGQVIIWLFQCYWALSKTRGNAICVEEHNLSETEVAQAAVVVSLIDELGLEGGRGKEGRECEREKLHMMGYLFRCPLPTAQSGSGNYFGPNHCWAKLGYHRCPQIFVGIHTHVDSSHMLILNIMRIVVATHI